MSTAAVLDEVIEELYARHTADSEGAGTARRDYEERRGKVHQDDELWEPWSAAFVEWYVVERVAPGETEPPAARTYRELVAAGDPRAGVARALVTSQNHGFIVDPASLPSGVQLTHENLFDHSNEGIAVEGKPIFSVQYHPEASPGPHDASYLFARFRDHLRKAT